MSSNTKLRWFEELPRLPQPVRTVLVVGMHVLLFGAAYLGAFLLRFDFGIPPEWEPVIMETLPWVLGIKLGIFALLGMYQGWWKYVSLYDLMELTRGLVIATAVLIAFNLFVLEPTIFPRSIYFLDFGLALFLLGGARGSLRLLREAVRSRAGLRDDAVNLLIMGAGDTGETLIREIHKNRNLPFRPLGFLDDDPYKRGLRIHGVPVLGSIGEAEVIAKKYDVGQIIIAMPSASRTELRRVVEAARATEADVKILPAVESILDGGGTALNQLREVALSDLLGRDPVRLDPQSMGRFLQGRRVLVTGAGGSIGSEICRQVLRFDPASLIMVERGETPLFLIHRELNDEHGDRLEPCIADVTDRDRMTEIFSRHQPEVVIHAAAYKHVPLMEAHPAQAVWNNVMGSKVVADLAAERGIDNFVLVSTDKAVNPTSVMGVTKRVTELYVLSLNDDCDTHFCAVRFGNVLGSNGSVVPIFKDQIRNGGPVTVTHPEMTRYFMTIPEASQLVLQAAANGQGGELFILDMGEPVKIADLARDMIRLSGLREDEIEIVYSGVRPGEKLFEELTLDEEKLDKTKHDKIFIGNNASDHERLSDHLDDLLSAAHHGDDLGSRRMLKAIVPQYSWEDNENVVPFTRRGDNRTPAE